VSLVGPHGLGFLTLLAGLLLGLRRFWALAVSALLVAMGWSYGAWQLAQPLPEREEPFVVRVVQPNATQSLKWVPELQALYFRRLMELTAAPGAVQPDAVIWPETAVPYLLGETPEFEAAAAAAAGPDTALILGIRRRSFGPEGEHWYNSLAVLGPGGAVEARYDKHHLVPFGEFIPLSGAIARLGLPQLTGLTATGFSAGPGPRLVDVPGVPPFLPLICYEAVFPHQMRAPGGRPDWMVQLTNDAWFGRIAGPYQHLAQARARAIEQGLPLVRAANTGISAVIDARGRVLVQLELGVSGRLDIALPSAAVHTFYGLFGDWPAILAILVTFALTVATILGGNSTRYRR
jgi:apolipoprotein N-acyltransferase